MHTLTLKQRWCRCRELAKRINPGKCGPLNDIRAWIHGHDPLLVIVDDFGHRKYIRDSIADVLNVGERGSPLLYSNSVSCSFWRVNSPMYVSSSWKPSVMSQSIRTGRRYICRRRRTDVCTGSLLQVGRQLNPQNPLGYGDMGALVAFYNTIPNNTLPVFWSSGTVNDRPWKALLPRASFV